MELYPLKKIKCGKQCFIPDYEVVRMRNASFVDGYITACIDTPEDLEGMDAEDRIAYMIEAMEKSAKLTRNPPPQIPENQ